MLNRENKNAYKEKLRNDINKYANNTNAMLHCFWKRLVFLFLYNSWFFFVYYWLSRFNNQYNNHPIFFVYCFSCSSCKESTMMNFGSHFDLHEPIKGNQFMYFIFINMVSTMADFSSSKVSYKEVLKDKSDEDCKRFLKKDRDEY